MLICPNCKRTIDESDLTTHKEFISYYGDDKYYETYADNCSCGGEWEEAEKCSCCEEWCTDSDLIDGWVHNIKICKECLAYYRGKYERIYNQINDEVVFIDWLYENGNI